MFRLIVVLLAFAVTCSCGSIKRAETAEQAQTAMVGMSKERILACMGVPAHKAMEGETEVWEYLAGDGVQGVSLSGTTDSGGYSRFSGSSSQFYCRVDLVIRGGTVSTVNYSGPTGSLLSKGSTCAYAVQNCVR